MFNNVAETLPAIRQGRVRPLAVTTTTRLGTPPDVPTLNEAGVAGFEVSGSGGAVAPSRTPTEVIATLNAAINEALRDAATLERLRSMELLVTGGTPATYATAIRGESEKFGRLVRQSGAKVD